MHLSAGISIAQVLARARRLVKPLSGSIHGRQSVIGRAPEPYVLP